MCNAFNLLRIIILNIVFMASDGHFYVCLCVSAFSYSIFVQNSKFSHAPGKNLPIALSSWLIEFKTQNYCITYDLHKLLGIKENSDTYEHAEIPLLVLKMCVLFPKVCTYHKKGLCGR